MLLKMININKSFNGNQVLHHINFELKPGEIHGIVGKNGAGKSTLINIAMGLYKPDSGEMYVNDEPVRFKSVKDAHARGITVIHQTPNLVPEMSVAENIFLGVEPRFLKFFVNPLKMRKEAKKLLSVLGSSINPKVKVKNTSAREHYLIAIMKAICHQSKILIMDEPTANLSESERNELYKLMKQYRDNGMGILFITHNISEIHKLCDRVTVLRDGRQIATKAVSEVNEQELTKLMVGHEIEHYYPPVKVAGKSELLKIENVSKRPYLHNVNFSLHEGEILGIAGLAGSGSSEMAKIIFGQMKKDSGNIYWKNKKIDFVHPTEAVHNGFGYVSGNRFSSGLLMNMSVMKNLSLASLESMNKLNFINPHVEVDESLDKVIDLNIKVNNVNQKVQFLSGGSQQKVMLGRWLMAKSDLYLLDEPTIGVDISSRCELYVKIHELADEGRGIIVISSDTSELIGLCSRILVMHKGQVVADMINDNLSEETLYQLINGKKK